MEVNKTFGELEKGDTIYAYYDGEITEETVKDVFNNRKKCSWHVELNPSSKEEKFEKGDSVVVAAKASKNYEKDIEVFPKDVDCVWDYPESIYWIISTNKETLKKAVYSLEGNCEYHCNMYGEKIKLNFD